MLLSSCLQCDKGAVGKKEHRDRDAPNKKENNEDRELSWPFEIWYTLYCALQIDCTSEISLFILQGGHASWVSGKPE